MRHLALMKNENRPTAMPVNACAHASLHGHNRSAATLFRVWAGVLLTAVVAAGCSSVELDQAPDEPLTSVDTWQLKMTRPAANQVLIAYTPPESTQRQYTGANHQSDGKVMVVSLRSCLVSEECPTLIPAQVRSGVGHTRWYEVVVPYRGEQVVVEGDGPGRQVLPLTP